MRWLGVALAAAVGFCCPCLSSGVRGNDFPSGPIKVYVGFSAGGAADIIARAIGSVAQEFLGQPLVIINKPGASGTLAAREVAAAKPDGYTLLIAGGSETTCVGHFRKLSYHPINSFEPIMRVARLGLFLTVRGNTEWETAREFVAAARQKPGKYIYASAGYGSLAHGTMLLFCRQASIRMKHLPFRGGTAGLVALRGGHVDVGVAAENEIRSVAEALNLRTLAVASRERSPLIPDAPTLLELGYNIYLENQKGFVAPAGTPRDRLQILHDALKKAYDHPQFVSLCKRLSIERAYLGPEDFRDSLRDMYKQVEKAVSRGGASPDPHK